MKKAFTLLEVVISLTIFLIIVTFIYKVLDDTKISNNKFKEHTLKSLDVNDFYKIIAEDIAESMDKISITQDKDKNSILIFRSNNSFNNPFFNNITYMLDSESNLVRIESKDKFEKAKLGMDFFNNSFIDILLKDIEKFMVILKDDKYIFIIKQKDREELIFPTFKME